MKKIDVEGLKVIQLEMLKEIDSYCRNNSLKYSLAFGSLLGAVRHKGYIPWDDDLDIMLPREDYDKFISEFNHSCYAIADINRNSDYSLPFAKVYDKRTVMDEFAKMKNTYGVYIDVFPIDNVPDDPDELQKFLKAKSTLNKKHILKIVRIRKERNLIKNIILLLGQIILCFQSTHNIAKSMNDLSAKYAYLKHSKRKGIIAPNDNRKEELLPAEYFENYTTLAFEGFNAMVIEKYDEYLTASYGNYMQLPPIEKRISHHVFKAWWKD